VVGPAIAAIIVFVIAVLTSYPHLIWLVLFLGIWRLLQDYVNAPRIMGKSLEISPLVQILAVLAGGEIAGVVGALISVPAVATLRILWKRLTSEKGADAPITPIPGDPGARRIRATCLLDVVTAQPVAFCEGQRQRLHSLWPVGEAGLVVEQHILAFRSGTLVA
jgi:hypothetical protein